MKNLVENLKQKINNRTPLGEIVDVFCEECSADLPEKNFLFETGLYQFTCDEEYYFSLVLQYKDSGDEYLQYWQPAWDSDGLIHISPRNQDHS